jgi:hypothetical protein
MCSTVIFRPGKIFQLDFQVETRYKKRMTLDEFQEICEAHKEETMWYLFLNYGAPVDDPEYVEKYNAVRKSLEEYIAFMHAQEKLVKPDMGEDEDSELTL